MPSDPLFDFYKRARNKLRRYNPQSVIAHAVTILHKVEDADVQILRKYQPWNILLALKWGLQEADELSYRRPAAKLTDLHVVLNILHDIEASVRMPDSYEHVNLFMRHLAFQQFWLQQGASGEALVRQDLMFSSLPPDHTFSRAFESLTQVRTADFLELAFALVTLLLKRPPPKMVRRKSFELLEPNLAPAALDGFFRHLSKSIHELHVWLTSEQFRGLSVADQRILPSPLVDAPLIRVGADDHAIIFSTLLLRSLESVVYRTLRGRDPAAFGVRFGPIFEKYVGRCLTDAGLKYQDEDWLNAHLPGRGKCVDFLVTSEDATVLIDAKGVETSARGRVSQRAELVLGTIKESAVNAIEQGIATARRMEQARAAGKLFDYGRELFLIVVTFDNLFLGSSSELHALFGSRLLPKLERDYGAPLPISLEQVFFLTIDEFERLLARVFAKDGTVAAILRYARDSDAHRLSRKFHFQQHLDSFSTQAGRLPMLEAGLTDLCQRCIVRLPGDQR
jgi:hypothetical protein